MRKENWVNWFTGSSLRTVLLLGMRLIWDKMYEMQKQEKICLAGGKIFHSSKENQR